MFIRSERSGTPVIPAVHSPRTGLSPQLLSSLVVLVTSAVAISATLIMEELGAEWIHAVWVVIAVALLIDLDLLSKQVDVRSRFFAQVRKMVAGIVGLALGVVVGVVVRQLYYWGAPRWSILVIRVCVQTGLFFASSMVLAAKPGRSHGRARAAFLSITQAELVVVCIAASLPLFCSRASLALARVVAFLFGSAIVVVVGGIAYAWTIRPVAGGPPRLAISDSDFELIDLTLSLASKVLRGNDNDKEEVDAISSDIHAKLTSSSSTLLTSHARPVVFECFSLYWSLMSGSVAPFFHQQSGSMLCSSREAFQREFGSSLNKIEDGIDGIRSDLDQLLQTASGEDFHENLSSAVYRLQNRWIGRNLVEGIQGMEFHLANSGGRTSLFASPTQRWLMASYLVNLSTLVASVIGFAQIALAQNPLAKPFVDDSVFELSLTRIDAIQKMGSLAALTTNSAPTTSPASPSHQLSELTDPRQPLV